MIEPRVFDKYGHRPFYLVQRLYESPASRYKETFPNSKIASNPFGYGRLGDYELDYMGAAEFEWGAIPKAANRMYEAGDGLVFQTHTLLGNNLIFLYIEEEGDPTEEFDRWVIETRCDGQEPAYTLHDRITNPEGFAKKMAALKYHRETTVWWALNENVLWSFVEEDGSSHLEKMMASMQEVDSEFLR